MNGSTTCRSCGAPIFFIKTKGGKSMPCNIVAVHYRGVGKGKDTVITQDGDVLKCEIATYPGKAEGFGYVPHWSTCNAPEKFRKNKKGAKQ